MLTAKSWFGLAIHIQVFGSLSLYTWIPFLVFVFFKKGWVGKHSLLYMKKNSSLITDNYGLIVICDFSEWGGGSPGQGTSEVHLNLQAKNSLTFLLQSENVSTLGTVGPLPGLANALTLPHSGANLEHMRYKIYHQNVKPTHPIIYTHRTFTPHIMLT